MSQMKRNNKNDKQYWRSFEDLNNTPEFHRFARSEFPQPAGEMNDAVSRRRFISLMGASMAFSGLAACRKPVEKIVPHVRPPEDMVPGVPVNYATTMPFGVHSYGLLVKTSDGRPIKIEGNENHPSSLGAANCFVQAEILNFYDPDRSAQVKQKGVEKQWADFVDEWQSYYGRFRQSGDEGLAVLSESFSSPTLERLKNDFDRYFPKATWYVYEPVSDENISKGIRAAANGDFFPIYNFDSAEVVLSLDADFLHMEGENIANAAKFAVKRELKTPEDRINRLYVVESVYSVTGANADHRLRMQSRLIGSFTLALARELTELGLQLNIDPALFKTDAEFDAAWLRAVAKDLMNNKGRGIVVAGRRQPPAVHALICALNDALGNTGRTIVFSSARQILLPDREKLINLKKGIEAGTINTLIVFGGNPVYNAPADLDFKHLLLSLDLSIHTGPYYDETAQKCDWHLPQSHFLEYWGDARAVDGTSSVIQPLIEPLHNGHSPVEFLNLIVTGRDLNGYEIVRGTWKNMLNTPEFETEWRRVLHDGLYAGKNKVETGPVLQYKAVEVFLAANPLNRNKTSHKNPEILFRASPSVFDGRYANNGWLQELPRPVSRLTWDNAAEMSPRTAQQLDLKNGDMIRFEYNGTTVLMPVWIVPGQADNSVSLCLGYGRKSGGRIGDSVGVDVYPLRTLKSPDFTAEVAVSKASGREELVSTQDHGSMEGRPLIREADLTEYKHEPGFAREMVEHPPLKNLWKEHQYDKGYQWGMVVDLNKCIGCNACVIACQSENNIPVVGKKQVANGREMHWIRIDRYFSGEPENPRVVYQPVMCQHCENAPCEQVCPVAATVHDDEGLNLMTYNRCVGTRYCSNNCPYKVRRFNFFNYHKQMPETVKMLQNPDVTVRSRGVMEKCTFCLQRINAAKRKAKMEGRALEDSKVKTACQQSCPADAITFGNILDPESKVAKLYEHNRAYAVLGELNVRPRVLYLAKVRNPNPELPDTNHKVDDIGLVKK